MGFQYTPVDSMATSVTPSFASQSESASRSGVVVPKVLTCFVRRPSLSGKRAHTTSSAWPTSIPAQRSISSSSSSTGGFLVAMGTSLVAADAAHREVRSDQRI